MNPKARRRNGPGALETIETAVHLLRIAPAGTLAAYHLGALPFVLGLLFFWADMSRNPFATQHAAAVSLGMAGLFLWLKFWQAVFAQRLRAQLSGEDPPPLTVARAAKMFLTQTAVQPTALFVLPLALIPALPFAWLYAFYQTWTVQAAADVPTLRASVRQSWRLTLLWPAQNHVILATLFLFALFVFIGLAIAGVMLPALLKLLFGVETVFTRSGLAMVNSTYLTAVFGVTFLCVDPILKAIYVLRVFQGESLRSGEDLRAGLKPFSPMAGRLAIGLAFFLMAATASPARAQTAAPAAPPPRSVSSQELDRAIEEVIHQRKYTWRMPREKQVDDPSASESGVVASFFKRIGKMIQNTARKTAEWLERVLRKLFGSPRTGPGSSGYGWIMTKQMLLYGLLAVVISAIALLLIRFWRRRGRAPGAVAAEAVQPAPDLTDENVAPDQLPEDGWTALARELLGRGELRLALRAFYLASLAHLAARNLVSLARFKSNRDYERELRRRAHAFPDLQTLFADNVLAFDRVWYGRHEATGELVTQFAANVERIKAGG